MGTQTEQNKPQSICYHYQFVFEDQSKKDVRIVLDKETLGLIAETPDNKPDWTLLTYCQCPNCPLEESTHRHCPVALNLVSVIDSFKECISFHEVDVTVTSKERIYQKHITLQNALSSVLGLFMATSGCPILSQLRPMVWTHLPFASMEETSYRVISMYLLAQYFIYKKGENPDWEIARLPKIYEEIQTINLAFHKRIAKVHIQDAGLNALFRLDCFAKSANILLLEKGLGEIEKNFSMLVSRPK